METFTRRRKRCVHDDGFRRRIVQKKHRVREQTMTTGDVDDATAAKETTNSPRSFPGFEELLARQASRVTHGTREPMKERVVGKAAEIVVGQSAARRERKSQSALHRVAVYLDASHVHVAAGTVTASWHQVREADLVDLAGIRMIDPVTDCDHTRYVQFDPAQIGNGNIRLIEVERRPGGAV